MVYNTSEETFTKSNHIINSEHISNGCHIAEGCKLDVMFFDKLNTQYTRNATKWINSLEKRMFVTSDVNNASTLHKLVTFPCIVPSCLNYWGPTNKTK